MKNNDTKFDDFLIDKNDEIDNTVFEAIRSMSTDKIEWNMRNISIIAEVEDFIETMLTKRKMSTCHPFYEEDLDGERTPCYRGTDCCNKDCPFYAMIKGSEHNA